jgi:2'-5' RNA ligase
MAIRSFIAIELPGDIQEALGRIQERLRSAEAPVGWVDPCNIHLTTKFLGYVAEPDIPKVCEVMKSAAAHTKSFELEVAGLGTFPPTGSPRVVWAGVRGELEPLAELVEEIEQGVADAVGIRPEHRPFHPHLTLGRVKSTGNADRLKTAMLECGPAEAGSFTADGLTLFMSELRRDGSVYTPMAEMRFEGETRKT